MAFWCVVMRKNKMRSLPNGLCLSMVLIVLQLLPLVFFQWRKKVRWWGFPILCSRVQMFQTVPNHT